MIDFDLGVEKLNRYLGSEIKTTVVLDNEIWMIKYPDPIRDKKNVLSYMNNQYSEHIGCSIFLSCGIKAQHTALGYFTDVNGKRKVVVGCKDFTQDGSVLHEFAKLGNQTMVEGKAGTTIESVNDIISQSGFILNKEGILNGFWDMFVLDALIGNPDRHFDNWGVLDNNGDISFAPVYDCGSSLAALIDDERMKTLLLNPVEFRNEEYNLTSCYYISGKRVFYHEIFKALPERLAEAVKRIVPVINIDEVHSIVNSVSVMPDVRKEYLIKALDMRYKKILRPALARAEVSNTP